MAKIEMYFRPTCPYCIKAIALLEGKGQTIEKTNITDHPEQRDVMIERTNGGNTVPQIFINGDHIGGCDDLVALDDAGKLDGLLG